MKKSNFSKKIVLVAILAILVSGTLSAPSTAEAFDLSLLTNWFKGKTVKAEEPVDDRAARLDAYFAKRSMPLEGYGAEFVKMADKYNIDWRLLPAIGVRESSGGKRLMNNNPFGWGSARIKFADFNEAIEETGRNISGNDEDTSRYYKGKDTYGILWMYNGTVMASYPNEVIAIMNMF